MFDKFLPKKQRPEKGTSKVFKIPQNFCELFDQKYWSEIFSDSTPLKLSDPSLAWIDPPSEEFIKYVLTRPQLGFDGVPPDEDLYKKQPTFMIAQMHRLWVTIKIIRNLIKDRSDISILDVGAFPFSIEIILRDYVKFKGTIFVTTNWKLENSWIGELQDRNIKIGYTNLDPFVASGIDLPDMKNHFDMEKNSVDLVISTHVVEHLYHPYTMFQEINRVLKQGGKFLITTDNAFMLPAVLNICKLSDWIHEPVKNTAAMSFHQWRGHNRFFSSNDLKTLLEETGFNFLHAEYYELFYNSFNDEFFKNPVHTIPKWKADILTWMPEYRNEIVVTAEKR